MEIHQPFVPFVPGPCTCRPGQVPKDQGLGPKPWVLEPFVLGPKDQGPQDQGDQGHFRGRLYPILSEEKWPGKSFPQEEEELENQRL